MRRWLSGAKLATLHPFKSLLLAAALAILGTIAVHADDSLQTAVIGPFGLLNSVDDPAIIAASQAQALLNVDITPGGRSVKKREGYSLDATFTTSSGPVHGAYKFFDASGNEVRLFGQDNGLRASVSGAAYVRVATGTVGATWQCTDYLGFGYCVTSSHDTPVKTNGTLAGTTYQTTIPAGTMIASTPDRLLVAGTVSNPARLYYSGSTALTDFTIGSLATSSSYEDITAPGSGLTHVAYRYGKWLWWKDQSFGYMVGTGQFDLQLITISNTIGTLDNTDVYDSGLTYFRGSDNHFYTFDGANLQRISRDITPTVNSANRRKAGLLIQTSQTDFQAGSILPVNQLSTTISPGDVIVSSFGVLQNSTSAYRTNLVLNNVLISGNSIAGGTDGGFENTTSQGYFSPQWISTIDGSIVTVTGFTPNICTLNPQAGTFFMRTTGMGSSNATARILKASDNSILYSKVLSGCGQTCSWSADSLSSSGITGNDVKIQFVNGLDGATVTTASSFTLTGDISFQANCNQSAGSNVESIDSISGGGFSTSNFTSAVFDTSFSSAILNTNVSWNSNSTAPAFSVWHASSTTGPWTMVNPSTGTHAWVNRYLQFTSTFTLSTTAVSASSITSISLVARSTGSYYSAINFDSAMTSWGIFQVADSSSGAGTITYYTRASTNTFTVTSSTPAWVSQTKNATVSASTGTYFQMRADFLITASTETPTMNDFTWNWVDGSAADQMYGTYFNYAIWFAVSLGSNTSTNNRILRYDLLNQGWNVYDIASNGFLAYNNNLYFGDPTAGKIYKFGGVTSDNGVAINSYWKSKDFFGTTPFTDEDIKTMSWYCKKSQGTTLSVSSTLNEKTTSTYSISLTDSKANIIKSNYNMPTGTLGNVFNVQIGDNSVNPAWECFAGQYQFTPKPWNAYAPQ